METQLGQLVLLRSGFELLALPQRSVVFHSVRVCARVCMCVYDEF